VVSLGEKKTSFIDLISIVEWYHHPVKDTNEGKTETETCVTEQASLDFSGGYPVTQTPRAFPFVTRLPSNYQKGGRATLTAGRPSNQSLDMKRALLGLPEPKPEPEPEERLEMVNQERLDREGFE